MQQQSTKAARQQQFNSKHPVPWRPGEREELIAEALARGRVTQVPRGVSAYDTHSGSDVNGWRLRRDT